jgi:hypothetical protein
MLAAPRQRVRRSRRTEAIWSPVLPGRRHVTFVPVREGPQVGFQAGLAYLDCVHALDDPLLLIEEAACAARENYEFRLAASSWPA